LELNSKYAHGALLNSAVLPYGDGLRQIMKRAGYSPRYGAGVTQTVTVTGAPTK
jgi:hypothetical protein